MLVALLAEIREYFVKVVVCKVNTNLPLLVLFSLVSKKFVPFSRIGGLARLFRAQEFLLSPLGDFKSRGRTAVLNF